jgi:E3 ubiquitin-protein ligase NEDD4
MNPDLSCWFEFAGRFLGMAFFHKQLIGMKFSSGFCNAFLGRIVGVEDLRDVDMDVYRSVVQILNAPSIAGWDLTFSVVEVVDGRRTQVPLVKGRSVDEEVTDDNKREYLRALINYHLKFDEQMALILKGFCDVVPSEVPQIFRWIELRMLLSGADKINVADWKSNTEYEGFGENPELAECIVWFWDIVENELDEEQLAGLLQFATGSPFVPATGFKDLQGPSGKTKKFKIVYAPESRRVTAHTCFNSIDLPPVETRELLHLAILDCAGEGSVGFQTG